VRAIQLVGEEVECQPSPLFSFQTSPPTRDIKFPCSEKQYMRSRILRGNVP
jgi:hypothetical protein